MSGEATLLPLSIPRTQLWPIQTLRSSSSASQGKEQEATTHTFEKPGLWTMEERQPVDPALKEL